jgi:hypothetical protein
MAYLGLRRSVVYSLTIFLIGRAGWCIAAQPVIDIPVQSPVTDPLGNHWTIGPLSSSQTGNQPVYADVADLCVDSTRPNFTPGHARLEPNGEVVFNFDPGNGYTLTRRARVVENGLVLRVADVITSTDGRAHCIWYGAHMQMPSRNVEAIQSDGGLVGYILEDIQGRAVVEIWGATAGAATFKIDPRANNNGIVAEDGGTPLAAYGGRPVAIVHLHGTTADIASAHALVASLNSDKILADLPDDLRGHAVNFLPATQLISIADLLRGDESDVVELRSGQRLHGLIQEKSLHLHNVVGNLEVQLSELEGAVMNKGPDWDCNLLTRGGDVLRGRLELASVHLLLPDGNTTEVPASEITRLGMHAGSAATQPAEAAWISTAGGDQIGIELPTVPIEIDTRYGALKIDPAVIAEINFSQVGHNDHEIVLADGSRISGILTSPTIELKPRQIGSSPITLAVSALSTLHLRMPASQDKTKAMIKLIGGDVLVAKITGDISLDTTFNAATIHTSELTSLTPLPGSQASVIATLSDGVTVHGRLKGDDVACETAAGVVLRVPVLLIADYVQPQPSATMEQAAAVRRLVVQLSADDWKDRERAQAQLIAMGPVVVDLLQKLRPDQTPEGQQRINTVLVALQNQTKP